MSTSRPKIWLSSPHMGGQELEFVKDAFATNWVSPVGPHITAFESELAQYAGVEHCAALSSGTAAIHLALIILGVGRDDQVICSTFTFSGSCNPIAYVGATPVFVDSEKDTWNMDPSLLEDAIVAGIRKGRKPKAIILVHLYGTPAMMEEIMAIASQYEIPVIEDAAEALGASYHNRKLGSFGDFSVFSFNGNKIITTSGGGALLSNNDAWIKKARFLATQARDQAPHYEHSTIGYNYRLSNVSAAIGRGQMQVLDQRVAQRRGNFDRYREALKKVHWISFPEDLPGMFPNRWLTTVVFQMPDNQNFKMREAVRIALENANIESRPLWKPMHLQPVFKDAPAYVNGVSEGLFNAGLCLPSGSNMSSEDVEAVCHILKSF